MVRLFTSRARCVFTGLLALVLLPLAGCNREKDASLIGTFRMGERVPAGPLIYTVLEADWKTQLENGKMPANRFLFLRVSTTNSSGGQIAVPGMKLIGPNNKEYHEVSEGLEGVSNWMGILRNIGPAQTETGYVIFDAPMAAYKLVVSDAGEIGSERLAHVDIPVDLE